MAIPPALRRQFSEIIEVSNFTWALIDEIATSDSNILRPIKGVCFEESFRILINRYMPGASFSLGIGDSDIDVILDRLNLQLKTCDQGSTRSNDRVGVALHKTHGQERRPYNLYNIANPTFDYLVVQHPDDGILIVPYDQIPQNSRWQGYLADPAHFDWDSGWLNQWDLLGFPALRGQSLENRVVPTVSELPRLSAVTYLEDLEIIRALCRPAYFRAAVMGLKGNIKQRWMIDQFRSAVTSVTDPSEAYPKHDCTVTNRRGAEFKIQIKGTSRNMCDADSEKIGVEVMGTHGRFPERGYKQSYFDYLAVVVSEDQINSSYPVNIGLHFVIIPVTDLPLHYLIGNGQSTVLSGWGNARWNEPEFSDVLYPNVKLKTRYDASLNHVEVSPYLDRYRGYRGHQTISPTSRFRTAGPWILDEIPDILL